MEEIIDAINKNTIMELHNKIRGNNIIVINKKNILFWNDNTKLWMNGTSKMIVDDMVSYFGKIIQDEISNCKVNEYKKMGQYTSLFTKLDEIVGNKYDMQYVKKYENSKFEDAINNYNIGIPIQNYNLCDYVNGVIRQREITDYYTKEFVIPQLVCDAEEAESVDSNENVEETCKYLIKYKDNTYIKIHDCFKFDKKMQRGFIYIVRDKKSKKFIPLRYEVYKVGKTCQLCNRMYGYGDDVELCFILLCEKNLGEIEKTIMYALRNDTEIIYEKSIGNEYFSGNLTTIIKKITDIVDKNNGLRNYKEDIETGLWFGTNIDNESITSTISKSKLKDDYVRNLNDIDI